MVAVKSSEYLKDALKVQVGFNRDGKPILIDPKKKQLSFIRTRINGVVKERRA